MIEINSKKYVTHNEILTKKMFSGYFLTKDKLNLLSSQGTIHTIKKSHATYYAVEDIISYTIKMDDFSQNYSSVKLCYVNLFPSEIPHQRTIEKFNDVLKHLGFQVYNFPFLPLNLPQNYMKNKDIENFKENYIAFNQLFEDQNLTLSKGTFYKILKKNHVKTIRFFKNYHHMYVSVRDYQYIESRKDDYELLNVVKALNLSSLSHLNEVLKEYNVEKYMGVNQKRFIRIKDVDFLIAKQRESIEFINTNYYEFQELQNLFKKLGKYKAPTEKMAKFNNLLIPPIAKIGKYRNKTVVYPKRDIQTHINKIKRDDLISNALKVTSTNYIKHFELLMDLYNINLDDHSSFTIKNWDIHIRTKLKSTSASHETRIALISRLVIITEQLITIIGSREIYDFSSKELEISIFSKKNSYNFRKELYVFLKKFNEVIMLNDIKPMDLKKYYYSLEASSDLKKKIYEVDEYLDLCNFVSDYEFHKDACLIILNQYEETLSSPYMGYSSYWLYVLLHLNNAFRRSDVLNFYSDSINVLDYLKINSIKDIEMLDLTEEQINFVIKSFQLSWYKHNKNQEVSPFYCSELLSKSFVYAVIFCEYNQKFRKIPNNTKLLNFNTQRNLPNAVIKKRFFKEFKVKNFSFESRKMNRTLITIISSVISNNSDIDSVNIARHLRGHVSIEMTNTYVNIPDEQIDSILTKVFEKGNFGYVYDLLIKKLKSQDRIEDNELLKVNIVNSIKTIFGEVSQLEILTNQLSYIYNRRKESLNYVNSLSKDDIYNQLKRISLSLSPAKDQNYQCLFNTCISIKSSCYQCPFSIPHWYELVTIGERFQKNISIYLQEHNNVDSEWGEMQRIYNLILLDLTYILEAKDEFGAEVINMVLKDDFNIVQERLLSLPDPLNQRKLENYNEG